MRDIELADFMRANPDVKVKPMDKFFKEIFLGSDFEIYYKNHFIGGDGESVYTVENRLKKYKERTQNND